MFSANNFDTEFWLIFGALAAIFFILFLFTAVSYFISFYNELQYLNTEIKRSDGTERKYYLRKKRRLWLSLVPFIKYR